jgi:hypothetical protein
VVIVLFGGTRVLPSSVTLPYDPVGHPAAVSSRTGQVRVPMQFQPCTLESSA